jgi:hypothetical protein
MNSAEYAELLKDPRWQRKRLEILQRDGWRCQWCLNPKATLHVHHKRYLPNRAPWEYEDRYLVTLCADCHQFDYDERAGCESDLIAILREAGASPMALHDFAGSIPLDLAVREIERLFSALAIVAREPTLRNELLRRLHLDSDKYHACAHLEAK